MCIDTINPEEVNEIAPELAAVEETSAALDASLYSAKPFENVTDQIQAYGEAKKAARAAGYSVEEIDAAVRRAITD